MNNLYRNYLASVTGSPWLIAAFDEANPGQVLVAATPQDPFAGTFGELGPTSGERIDVLKSGIDYIKAGAAFNEGDPLTSNSLGQAVKAVQPQIVQTVINGGAAGALTLNGITTNCTLLSVIEAIVAADTGTGASGNKLTLLTDLSSQFFISAANTITNAGGSTTTSNVLVVQYRQPPVRIIGFAEDFATAQGDLVYYRAAPCFLN